MTESIMVALVLSIVIILLGIWLKMSIKPNSEQLSEGSIQELNEKRDIAAQVPLLNKTIQDLESDKRKSAEIHEQMRKENSEKDVLFAEIKKDKIELQKDLEELDTKFSTAKEENKKFIDKITLMNQDIVGYKTTIEKKEYENRLIHTEKESNEKNNFNKLHDIKNELSGTKQKLQEQNNKYMTLLDTNSEVKALHSKTESEFNAQKKINFKVEETVSSLNDDLKISKNKYNELLETNSVIRSEKAKLEANVEAQEKNNKKLKEDFEEQSKRLELKLSEIMQNTLDSKIKKFDETSIKGIGDLLKPFKENLDTFKKKVEEQQESSIEKFASLSKEIEGVNKIGLSIGKEAENLATALKGKKQQQGSWGEMILESVLEHSGLLKDTHYVTQSSYRDSEGNTKRPDVIIKLPQERTIIIDSKVSLNDYSQFIQAESEEEQTISTKAMITAFKNHIDTLADKDYTEYKIGTLQYVFMFIPIEGAFSTAVQADPYLYEYALQKNIAIVNPSTLTVSLRTIYLYWQSEQSSTLAIKLFEEAGKLYDKMDNFAKSFKKIGNQLQTVNKTYDDAHKKLTEGTGNVLGRVEKLKQLGARTKGKLKDSIEFQSEELDMDDVEVAVIGSVNEQDDLVIDTEEA